MSRLHAPTAEEAWVRSQEVLKFVFEKTIGIY